MPNSYFQFKHFIIHQDKCSMKVTTDSCLFGAWVAADLQNTLFNNALDIGSGTGLLSFILAQETRAMIDGIELQKADFEQSVENLNLSKYKDRISFFNEDASIFSYTKRYDVIISNPPFYECDLKSDSDEKNKAHHDKGIRLQQLIELISGLLQPLGCFYILLPYKRKSYLQKLLHQYNFYINSTVHVRQTDHHTSFRIMVKASKIKLIEIKDEIVIKQFGNYTERFTNLLKPYYLNF